MDSRPEALLQLFVKIPDMEHLAIMANPIQFTCLELKCLKALTKNFAGQIPLATACDHKLDVIITALDKWEKEHA